VIEIPPFQDFMDPILQVLKERDGPASNEELMRQVPERMNLSAEQRAVERRRPGSTTTEVAYRIGWAKSYLKKAGLIANTGRSEWSITQAGVRAGRIDGTAVARESRRKKT